MSMTKLEAVNRMLRGIGEAPVNSLGGLSNDDAITAITVLDDVNREVQARGWWFNTNNELTINKDTKGEFPLSFNVLKFQPTGISYNESLIDRGGRVYDTRRNTFKLEVKEVQANIVVLLNYEELPQAAKDFISLKATRRLQDQVLGVDYLHRVQASDENFAWNQLIAEDTEVGNYSIHATGPSTRIHQFRNTRGNGWR